MNLRLSSLAVIIILSGLLIGGCATMQEYNQLKQRAEELESQQRYEEAYQNYLKASELNKYDKKIPAKLRELEKIISEIATDEGIRAFNDKKYKTALDGFGKALKFNAENMRATDFRPRALAKYNQIKQKYAKANTLKDANKWTEAVEVLQEIEVSYNDDPEIGSEIKKWRENGYTHYMKAGSEARQNGKYTDSLNYFTAAEALKSDAQSQAELKRAKEYVEADQYYIKAQRKVQVSKMIEAMAELIKARAIAVDHMGVNELINKLKPTWSPKIFEIGKNYVDAKQHDMAFEAFSQLYAINPDYPEAKAYYEQTKLTYLKNNYRHLVQAYSGNDFPMIAKYTQNILQVEPSFLDTNEMMTRALLKGFNIFYQRGLHYMNTGNYGKAILCFRSAEMQIAQSKLTQSLIDQAWDKIRASSALRVGFWDFFQQIGDPRMSTHATDKIKDLLKSKVEQKQFKNIVISFQDVKENEMMFQAGIPKNIDWAVIRSRGYNSIIAGNIRLLQVEETEREEWKTCTYRKSELVETREYRVLSSRRDQLKQALDSDSISWEKRNQLKSELRKIENDLLKIPPVETIYAEKQESYRVEKHTMTAHIQIDIQIARPGGSQIWPLKTYEDQYMVEDISFRPVPECDDPAVKQGDAMNLPTDSEFKKQAIDYVMTNKIYPDIMKNFENYGTRFYDRAIKLNQPEKPRQASVAFMNSIEEYYKFLASYEAEGDDDNLAGNVQNFLDSCVSDLWLLHKPGSPIE
jgi:tetratricopeptide (TPR) repeat protein